MFPKLVFSRFKILLLIYLLPFVVLLWFVATFSVNVPYWDEWELVDIFEKVSTGKASFGDFFAQHNEHRIVFPELIMVFFAFISKWNIGYEVYFSFFLAIITFFALYKLSSLKVENELSNSVVLTNILTCFLIFSLVQYENWLWGFQLAWLLINTCLAIAVLLIALSNNSPKRFYFAAIPCFIASFSLAHGLLTWLAVIPSIASLKGSSRQRRIRILIWILLFAGTCAIYLIGYQKPTSHPSPFFFLRKPLVAGKYFFTLLGNPLVNKPIATPIIGLIIFLIFCFLTFLFIKKSQPKFLLDVEVVSWISIGSFALLFAAMTTVGRAGFGVEQAMSSSRYTTSSLLLIISIVHLWRLFSWNNAFLAGTIIGLLFVNSVDAIPQASLLQQQRQASKNCLELVNFIDESINEPPGSCLTTLYPSTIRLKELAITLEKLGFRKFPREIKFKPASSPAHGFFDGISNGSSGPKIEVGQATTFEVSGWAILSNKKKPADLILITDGNTNSVVTVAPVNLKRPDVAKAMNNSAYKHSGWRAELNTSILPTSPIVINGWAYDSASKEATQLDNSLQVVVLN